MFIVEKCCCHCAGSYSEITQSLLELGYVSTFCVCHVYVISEDSSRECTGSLALRGLFQPHAEVLPQLVVICASISEIPSVLLGIHDGL